MTRISLNINPKILKWAREEAGYSDYEIASKLSIDTNRYKQWEKTGLGIPFGQLKKLANCFKRQLAFFFLKEVPSKAIKPKDFRNISPSDSKLSKDVHLIIRRVNNLQKVAGEFKGIAFWDQKYEWLKYIHETKNDNVTISRIIRDFLKISLDDQLNWKNDLEAYKNWRNAIEDKLGIIVFQFSMPLEELQGFCLIESKPFVIVTNSKQNYFGRIFTLFHELGHIIRHQSGLCLIENVELNQKEEWACNSLAGEILVPSNEIIKTKKLGDISSYSKLFKVSREVYLRKLKQDHLISDAVFFDLLNQIKSTYKKKEKKKGFVLPEVQSRASRGETFYNIIIDAINSNQITLSDASNILGLRVNKLISEI